MARKPTGGTRVTAPVVGTRPGDVGISIGGTPHAPTIDPRTVTTAGQTLSPQSEKSPQASQDMNAAWGPVPVMTGGMTFSEVGSSGLRQFSGWVREEFLQTLVGRQAAQKYREMMDNSSTVGALLFAIQSTMRKVEWRVLPADDSPKAKEAADFVDSSRNDMSQSWEDFIVEGLSMLPFGFAPMEIVYKRRNGKRPGPDPTRPGHDLPSSEYDDGMIGWRRLPLRGQDTIIKWFFDENGQVKGLTQQPWVGPLIDIPIEKLLLFRPIYYKSNPEGRALDPETMIPTPNGWRTLDGIDVGDKVFDDEGNIRYVTGRAEWHDRPCHRVVFGDGTEIIADDEHQWVTQTNYERQKRKFGKIRTTAEIAKSVKVCRGTVSNHSIPWSGALDYPTQHVLIDPYFLGLWLGDGTSLSASISCHAQDLEETVALIEGCGYGAAEVVSNGSPEGNGRLIKVYGDRKWDSQGPQTMLRVLGLKGDKHIPEAYLRGSISQRQALLSGLMDSDGHVDNCGRCEFSNTNYNLVRGVAELVRSLGIGARVTSKWNDHDTPTWLVKFTPTWVPFRLSRKAARCRTERQRMAHYITAVERVSPRRTICIEVDSPSHMFLVGESMVPTHNSILRNSYVSYYYLKRLQEQEAILFERLGGVPLIKIPGAVMEAAAAGDAAALAAVNMYKRIAINLRTDEQMGVVLPSDTYAGSNGPTAVEQYQFHLVTPQLRASGINFDPTIERYSTGILTSTLSDFLTLGHSARGTQALAISKVDMFFQAIEGYLNSMAAVINRFAIPRLWDLNGLDQDLRPTIEPDLAQRIDLDVLSNFVLRLAQAGMPLFPNEELQSYILDAGGLPDVQDDRALQAAGLLDDQLETQDQKDQATLDRMQQAAANPPEPGKPSAPGGTPLEKMLLASLARRQIRHAGPRFGVSTGLTKRGRKRHVHQRV
jgi:hypothetical protein